ncbi:MAG: hypothetical protein GXO49_03135 [Chlorobi bacterium]|nr:hypothetical protein [Chlorobiota bacterium]
MIGIFKNLNIPYMLSGSMAMSFYSVTRATRDIDIVVHMQEKDIDNFISNLNNFYFNKETIKKEIRNKGMFNIIDFKSGFKVDVIILKDTEYFLEAFKNKKILNELGYEVFVISLEDLILAKIIWIQQLQSERQKEDIKMLLNNENTDIQYINKWANKLKLKTFGLI